MKTKQMLMAIIIGVCGEVLNADPASVIRVSESRMYQEADAEANLPSVSPDDSHITFTNYSDALSDRDDNGSMDVYIYDVDAETCTPVSTSADGIIGNRASAYSSVSNGGRFVAFQSSANNLVENDTNGTRDIFVKNMQTGEVERVSVASNGTQADGMNQRPVISADGNLVVFESDATNLVDDDTNDACDVFVHDRKQGRTRRISVGPNGEGNHDSRGADISADGAWVVFHSMANNLTENDTNDASDIFLKRVQGNSDPVMVSVNASGIQGNGQSYSPSISSNGRYIAFDSAATNLTSNDTNGCSDIFRVDRENATIIRVSINSGGVQGNRQSINAAVTDRGLVYFESMANNLVSFDTNANWDVFYYDGLFTSMVSHQQYRVPGNAASLHPAVSANGSIVAFASAASNLVQGDNNAEADVFFRKGAHSLLKRANVTSSVAEDSNRSSQSPSVSGDGRFVAFNSFASNLVQGDTNGMFDIFVLDHITGQMERASVGEELQQANGASFKPSISPDGRYVAYESMATNLMPGDTNGCRDIYAVDRLNNYIYRILGNGEVEPNGDSYAPDISNNRTVAFFSSASNLVAGDTNGCADIFVANIITGEIERVSINSAGAEGNGSSAYPAISANSRYVAFVSSATNLVPGDINGVFDIFVYDRNMRTVERVSVSNSGAQGNGHSFIPDISDDGRYVSFYSNSSNLVENDTNDATDVFVYDREEHTIQRASLNNLGIQGNRASTDSRISGNGRYVVYRSEASNLILDDTNGHADIFVRDLRGNHTTRISLSELGAEPEALSFSPVISQDGLVIAFATAAALAAQDENGIEDIYLAFNPQPALVPGKVFPFAGSEIAGFTDDHLSLIPSIFATFIDPRRYREVRRNVNNLTVLNDGIMRIDFSVDCEWRNKVKLFNQIDPSWRNNFCRDAMQMNSPLNRSVELRASTQLIDGTRLENAEAGQKVLVSPQIAWVVNAETGEFGVPVQPQQRLQVGGAFFGSKTPKAWLEYKDAKGKVKQARCRVERTMYFNDYADNAGRSCMQVSSGFSVIDIQLPRTWPKDWMPGRHDLIIDNGCGRAFFRLLTE